MKTELEIIMDSARKHGFSAVSSLRADTIFLNPEVRKMCSLDKCRMYNRSWSCPPGCGTLKECTEDIRKYTSGIIVQTTGALEDSMDYEQMQKTELHHNQLFRTFTDKLRRNYRTLALGTGACRICHSCTYPDHPCRSPERMTSSMEAYGMLVSQICHDNQLPYYYGENTITYTSCYLIGES